MAVITGMHPVLDQQRFLNGGAVAFGGIPDRDADEIPFFGDGDFDRAIPRFVAGVLLGALVTLIALRALGFRFSFGVGGNIGGS